MTNFRLCKPHVDLNVITVQYTDDSERDRVEKIEAAAEGVETGLLDKDCSSTGCPGVNIVGQTGRTYHASYGRTQFIAATFIGTVNDLSLKDKQALGLNADMQQRLTQALTRASTVSGDNQTDGWFDLARKRTTCENAGSYWDKAGQPGAMSTADQNQFTTQTGLDRQAFIDMVCFVPEPPGRPRGEGLQAFVTESIFSNAILKDWIMGIFKSTDKFNFLSRSLIRQNLRTVLGIKELTDQFQNTEVLFPLPSDAYLARQRAIERNVTMRTARLHNGGPKGSAFATNVEDLLTKDAGSYVSKFLSSNGNWLSLRCATPDDNQARWHGLQLAPLQL